jgi:hypothetical protein
MHVPHLWVGVVEVLLHAKDGISWLILPELRVLELSQRLFDRSRTMDTQCPRTTVISALMGTNLLT